MWSEGNAHPMLVGVQICAITLEISVAVSKDIGSHPTSGTSNATLWYVLSYYKSICSAMIIAALSGIAIAWNQPRCPSREEWLMNVWIIYTLEFYPVVKSNDILNFAWKWMEIENALMIEIIKTQKDKYGMY